MMIDKHKKPDGENDFGEIDYCLDIDSLLIDKIIERGGDRDDFNSISSFITDYSKKTGRPEDGIALIFIDSLCSGMDVQQLLTQCEIYDLKGKCDLLR